MADSEPSGLFVNGALDESGRRKANTPTDTPWMILGSGTEHRPQSEPRAESRYLKYPIVDTPDVTQQALGPIYCSLKAGLYLFTFTFTFTFFLFSKIFSFHSRIRHAPYFILLALLLGPPSCECCPCPGASCQIGSAHDSETWRISSAGFVWIGERW